MFKKQICFNCKKDITDKHSKMNDHLALEHLRRTLLCRCRTEYNFECCSCDSKLECYLKGHKCNCGCGTVTQEGSTKC